MRTLTSIVAFNSVVAVSFALLLSATPAWAQGSPAERGAQVYAASKCAACHSVAGKGNAKGVLDKVGARLPAAEIREWLLNAPAMAAKSKAQRKPPMKAYAQLPPEDVDVLVAYLLTLK